MASLSDVLVEELLKARHIASLGTMNPDGSIHMVAVWYWFDGSHIDVATSSRSRKARNLQAAAKVALMIDSRDPMASCGVTLTGPVEILTGETAQKANTRIHAKYMSTAALADPKVGPVFAMWDDVTLRLTPTSVISWDMRLADRQVFAGAFASNPGYLLPLQL